MIRTDLHFHSELSSDASGTFEEIALALVEQKIEFAALTNHIPEIPGHIWYGDCDAVSKLKSERDKVADKYGVNLLIGAEIDVIDNSGTLAAPQSFIDELEFVVSGVHRYPNVTRNHEKHTQRPLRNMDSMHYGLAEYFAISIGLLRNPNIDVLVHPLYALDFLYSEEYKDSCIDEFPEIYIRDIMKIAAEENKAIELNSSVVHRMNEKWFYYGEQYGTKYSIGSDAHSPNRIGNIEKSLKVAEQYGLTEAQFITGRNK